MTVKLDATTHSNPLDQGHLQGIPICFLKLIPEISSNYCRVAINPPGEFYNVIDNSVVIEPGTEVLLRVEPIELSTDEAVGNDLDIESRKCRMADEVPEDIKYFKTSTRNACIYNCMFEYR